MNCCLLLFPPRTHCDVKACWDDGNPFMIEIISQINSVWFVFAFNVAYDIADINSSNDVMHDVLVVFVVVVVVPLPFLTTFGIARVLYFSILFV